jgi:hypothetical protein
MTISEMDGFLLRQPHPTKSLAVDPRYNVRRLRPLPDEYAAYRVGTCGVCGRPLTTKRMRQEHPELSIYLATAGGDARCQTCHRRGRQGHTTRLPRSKKRGSNDYYERPLPPEELTRLRAIVRCRGCGVPPTEHDGPVAVWVDHGPGCSAVW